MLNNAIFIEKEQLAESASRFNPTHIRPSAVGSPCLRQEVLRILHALYPNAEEYIPPVPDGKDPIRGMAKIGDIVENEALKQTRAILNQQGKKVFSQYELPNPKGLKNPDGSIVVAHPDIYVPSLGYDIEIKCVSTGAIHRLPNEQHRDQLLLRLLWWKEGKRKDITGILTYFFRETYYAPGTLAPIRYIFEPVLGGYNIKTDKGVLIDYFTLKYMRELEERLHYIAECVEKKILPDRTENYNDFPCYVHGRDFISQCPWREKCWARELAEERSPGVILEEVEDIILELVMVKERQKAKDKEAREAKNKAKELEEKLTPYFERYGNKITAGGYTISRTLVEIPEKVMKGYSYYRYSLRKQK